jgi:hypothetical protein
MKMQICCLNGTNDTQLSLRQIEFAEIAHGRCVAQAHQLAARMRTAAPLEEPMFEGSPLSGFEQRQVGRDPVRRLVTVPDRQSAPLCLHDFVVSSGKYIANDLTIILLDRHPRMRLKLYRLHLPRLNAK